MGKYRVLGSFLDRVFRNNLNANFDDVDADIKLQKARIDTLFQETPQADEALDIRVRSDGTVASTAGNRVRELDEQLADNTTDLIQRGINVRQPPYNAKGDGLTDDTTALQRAFVDATEGTTIYIPDTGNNYIIADALTLLSKKNITVILDGKVKLANSVITTLTADVVAGQDYVDVTSVAGFRVGQWVSVSDDNRTLQGGGAAHTKRTSDTFTIKSIVGNRITLNVPFKTAHTVVANAKIGTTPSAFLFYQCENITLKGKGQIDGNKTNQYHVEPVSPVGSTGEEVRAGCGVTAMLSPRTVIRDITIKNALLHNICMRTSAFSEVWNTVCDTPYDKNILGYTSQNCVYAYNKLTNSQFEDGIILYSDESNTKVIGNYIEGNARYGLRIHSPAKKIRMRDNYYKNNWQNINVYTDDFVSENEKSVGGGAPTSSMLTKTYGAIFGGNRGTISNLESSAGTGGYGNVLINTVVLTMTGGNITGTTGTTELGRGLTIAKDFSTPTKIKVSNVMITNCKLGVYVGDTISKILLDGVIYDGNTTNIDIAPLNASQVTQINTVA